MWGWVLLNLNCKNRKKMWGSNSIGVLQIRAVVTSNGAMTIWQQLVFQQVPLRSITASMTQAAKAMAQVDHPVSNVARRDIGRRTALCLHVARRDIGRKTALCLHLTILPLQVEVESYLHLVLVTSAARQGTGQKIAFLLEMLGGRH